MLEYCPTLLVNSSALAFSSPLRLTHSFLTLAGSSLALSRVSKVVHFVVIISCSALASSLNIPSKSLMARVSTGFESQRTMPRSKRKMMLTNVSVTEDSTRTSTSRLRIARPATLTIQSLNLKCNVIVLTTLTLWLDAFFKASPWLALLL